MQHLLAGLGDPQTRLDGRKTPVASSQNHLTEPQIYVTNRQTYLVGECVSPLRKLCVGSVLGW